jgi:7,8-dihydropterin-6-yl-methyl-4-(beta-D-ribofuranosyl)aminobenzene 5'-phosphate synthase
VSLEGRCDYSCERTLSLVVRREGVRDHAQGHCGCDRGGVAAAGLTAASTLKFERDRREAERLWHEAAPPRIEQPSSVGRLSVLPLIDHFAADETLIGEPGVSFLVRADDLTLLFDVGLNQKKSSPSSLVHNMATLGVSRDDIDCVFISHLHMDHVGGLKAQKARTFELTPEDPEPLSVDAYAPVDMVHSTARVKTVTGPMEIAPGVFSIGPIARSLWLMGLTQEQALAVNVEGKGVVLIIGCGHQTLERAVSRTETLFDLRLYGVIGGLHFPVTGSRMPYGMQKVIGTGRLPWQGIKKDDVRATVGFLEEKKPNLVGISAHDSCDWTLGTFKGAFGDRYREVVVGREIVV